MTANAQSHQAIHPKTRFWESRIRSSGWLKQISEEFRDQGAFPRASASGGS
jgi:hypothetical protein